MGYIKTQTENRQNDGKKENGKCDGGKNQGNQGNHQIHQNQKASFQTPAFLSLLFLFTYILLYERFNKMVTYYCFYVNVYAIYT